MSQDELKGGLQSSRLSFEWPLWSVLRSIVRNGELRIRGCSGKVHIFGDGAEPHVAVNLTDRKMERELLADPQLAAGEGYMRGRLQLERGSIYDFLALFAKNMAERRLPSWMTAFDKLREVTRRSRQLNSPERSKSNVHVHYDLPGELYALFLDSDRQYSCAYFPRGDETLEEAQLAKKRHIARKLILSPGQTVLDIGCGWGGLAIHLAREYGAKLKAITLSDEQFAYARERNDDLGKGVVEFSLKDYREIREQFDRIVSVGMFEHVGIPNYSIFFRKIAQCLKPDGVALLHTIGRLHGPGATNPFIEKYIFPGGYIPALSEVMPHIERAGLMITDVEVLRLHYAKTLAAWRSNFLSAWDKAASMLSEEFCRMWEFYLAGSEVAFRYHGLCVFQIQLAKQIDAVPITRNYMYQ